MIRKIAGYEIEISDKLKNTNMPFATRMSKFMIMPEVGDVQLLRTLSDCVIQLELLKEKSTNELIEYKKRFGEIK